MTFENFIKILSKKKQHERTNKDIQIISKFLEHTDLYKKFIKDEMDNDSLNKILYFCSLNVKYEFIEKNKILFRIGDIGDKFFIILKGKVDVLKIIDKEENMTPIDYYNFLRDLRDRNEDFLVKKIIQQNKHIFPVLVSDLDKMEDIIFKVKYRKTILMRPSVLQLKKVFDENKINPKDYDLDIDDLEEDSSVDEETIQKTLRSNRKLSSFIGDPRLKMYKYVENTFDKKKIIISVYESFMSLYTGQYFGDYALDSKSRRFI